jgi:hypothetical protein
VAWYTCQASKRSFSHSQFVKRDTYCHVIEWLCTGFALVIVFIEHLKNITTNNYDSLTDVHTPKITVTTAHIKFLSLLYLHRSLSGDEMHKYPLQPTPRIDSQSQSYVTTDGSQPVWPGVKHPGGAEDHIFITVTHLQVCWCGAPSLTRWRSCHLQLLLVLASAIILGSESRGTHDYTLLSPLRTGWPRYKTRHWVTFSSPPTTRWTTVDVDSLSRLSINCPAYNISASTAQKTLFLYCCFQMLPSKHAWLRCRYSITALYIWFFRSRCLSTGLQAT